jgi:predicted AlkP superfamily pyrophosphatase or phosphodiesterase
MLPAPPGGRSRLADVMRSCLAAVAGGSPVIPLPAVEKAIVLVVDGLGAEQLRDHAGHARTLAGALAAPRSTAWTVFPSTTASALASLTTGAAPGEHGLVGYSSYQPEHDRVVNDLSGWDERMPPEWQLRPTVFETAGEQGVAAHAIGEPRFADSGFTRAVLRGARYAGARTLAGRLERARAVLETSGPAILYVYAAELDKAGHAHGVDSPEWAAALEDVDAAVRETAPGLRRGEGMLVTADHGMVDATDRILFDATPELVEGVRHVAGEARCVQLVLEPGIDPDVVADRWRERHSRSAYIATRDELVAAGWLGERVDPRVAPRTGDVFVLARGRAAFSDGRRASPKSLEMVGQHGSISTAELSIPLLRFGAFA